MRIVAACDGGGTKCTVRIRAIDDGSTPIREGQATTGPANVRTDPESAAQNILSATQLALADAGLPTATRLDVFVGALAGAGKKEVQHQWQARLERQLSVDRVRIITDVEALFGASDWPADSAQVATIVGTGSIAWLRFADGTMRRAGGLGPLVGDEGGGFWIGKQAILASVNWPDDLLTERVVEACRAQSAERIVQDWNSGALDNRTVARVASDVFALADRSPCAAEIVEQAAGEIASIVVQVVAEEHSAAAELLPWIVAGGVAVHQPSWVERIRRQCSHCGVHLERPTMVEEPVAGALRLACELIA